MFDVGTKIILIESSHQKTIGPRKGSIGYVSNCKDFHIDADLNVSAALCEVYFIRYGFEKHRRLERRYIISVVPILKSIPEETAYQQITTLMSKLHSDELDRFIKAKYSNIFNVSIAMACPLVQAGVDLTTCDPNEFKAWVKSYLTNTPFENFIHESLQSKHYTNYKDSNINSPEIWNSILEVFMIDKYGKDAFMNSLLENEDARKRFIRAFKTIAISHSNGRMRLGSRLGDFSPMKQDKLMLYKIVSPSIFSKPMLRLYIAEYLRLESRKAKEVAFEVDQITQIYSEMSVDLMKTQSN